MSSEPNIIKYGGDNRTFIWKHPCRDFNNATHLIVYESQEAIFFKDGQALDLFGAGHYILEPDKMPLLKRLFNKEKDLSRFQCDVYFINKTEQMSIKWGTDTKIQFMEPTFGFPISIGACGEMSLRVEDSRKLLIKLVGTDTILDQQRLTSFFRALLVSKLKSYISQSIRTNGISIFEIDEHLDNFSTDIKRLLIPDFSDYGISLEKFYVTNIQKPEGDKEYERFKGLHFRQYADIAEAKLQQQTELIRAQTEAQKIIIDSQANATKRVQEGYTYQQERGFNIAEDIVNNDAIAPFTNIGVGLGSMSSISNNMGDMLKSAVETVSPSTTIKCSKCGKELPNGAKFCFDCGEPVKTDDELTTCPACGKMVHKGKFCLECGKKLIFTCPDCGKEIPPMSKFCPECGKTLK